MLIKDANPWCQPAWIKDTSQSNISIADMETPPLRTESEGSFTILSAKETDSGWYRCVCDHPLAVNGRSASYGYFLYVRPASEADAVAVAASNAAAVPGPAIDAALPFVTKSDSFSDERQATRIEEERIRKYDLLQSFYEDKQRAFCGDKEGMPLIVSFNRSVSAIANRPISLVAEFCCDPRPRKVFWIHRHLAVAPGRIIGPYVTKDLVPVSSFV